jgi:hypothetical protein
LTRLVTESVSDAVSAADVDNALAKLVASGLMVEDGESFLSLAIPLGDYTPSDTVLNRFDRLVDSLGTSRRDVVILSAPALSS